jgi:short-subunit dehydrogenase
VPRPIALVTGASSGIGEHLARQLAERDRDLVLVARDQQRLETLGKELERAHSAKVQVLPADLTDAAQLQIVEDRCHDSVAPIDVLVNNAGFGSFGPFHELDLENEVREIQLNVTALVRLSHAAASAMVPRGRGGILNVSSLAAFQPNPLMAVYGGTKAFIVSFTEALHEELKGTGVAVTVLCPGFTRTGFQAAADVPASGLPGFVWQEAGEVATVGLDALAKNRAVVIPGALNKVLGSLSIVTPHALTRRIAGVIVKQSG